MLIYLADPIHTYMGTKDTSFIPLGVLNIAAYAKLQLGDRIEIEVFKFPERILDAIDRRPPDVIGVSNYVWNYHLSKTILAHARKYNADVVTVMGGPNATLTASSMARFLADGVVDFYVQDNVLGGEKPFVSLISALMSGRSGLPKHKDLHGVTFLDRDTGTIREIKANVADDTLEWLPSPFEMGLVDEFFDDGLRAMISTNRNCPFQCTFCVWGNASKVLHSSVARVIADLDYCSTHAKQGLLMITDANYGLFKTRDLEIARHIRKLHHERQWPTSIVVNWGQVRSETAVEVADELKGITLLRQSSQSMNEDVLKAINRKNIPDSQWRHVAEECRRAGIESFAELIVMLPGETLETYLDGLRYFFNLGFSCINTNQCQILEGAEINTSEHREKYGVRTAWRLLEGAYGVYGDYVCLEAEEVVIETKDFTFDQNVKVRMLNWLIQMSWTLKRHDLIVKYVQENGVNPVDFFLAVIANGDCAPEGFRQIIRDFDKDAREELFPTYDALHGHYCQEDRLSSLSEDGFKKLNTFYSGIALELNDDILTFYREIARKLLPDLPAGVLSDCADFLTARSLTVEDLITTGDIAHKKKRFAHDWVSWDRDVERRPIAAFRSEVGHTFTFTAGEDQKTAIRAFVAAMSDKGRNYKMKKLCEPYYGIRKEYLNYVIA
ncbi:MAG: cobalamin B12-binding domain-containing protein [Rhodospirillaceae bacterium]|nr:cobalamin B12-binding domain-containing protein [Rhodospirillales bacterium]